MWFQGKKSFLFKMLLLTENARGHQRAPMVLCKEAHAVFILVNMTSTRQPMDQGIISTFPSYDLRNMFRKAVDSIESDSSDRAEQINCLERIHHPGWHEERL